MNEHTIKVFTACFLAMACYIAPSTTQALMIESFGKDIRVSAVNYSQWQGIVPFLKQGTPVYSRWVNGNEDFYYSGDVHAINEALQKFAAADIKTHEVILRPGPGWVAALTNGREMEFTWHANLGGGFSPAGRKSDLVWNPTPTMSIYVTDEIPLEKLIIPQNITLLELSHVAQRIREGLSSTDESVRGVGAGMLARLDPYDEVNMSFVIKLLDDPAPYVRSNAIGDVAVYGQKAREATDTLKRFMESDDERLKERAQKALKKIESAGDTSGAEMQHRKLLERIKQFREGAVKNEHLKPIPPFALIHSGQQ
jgi:hypothetical protein